MGRDDHFVSRLERFDDASAALAIELLRHRWIVDETISRASQAGATRVMLAMDERALGRRIVASMDGHFVTCLAPGFADGPWPRIDRARIESVRSAYWRSHARWVTGADDPRWAEALRAIEHGGSAPSELPGDTLARIVESDRSAASRAQQWYRARWRAAIVFLARRPEGFALDSRQRFEQWSVSWALVQLQSATEGRVIEAQHWSDGASREAAREREMAECDARARAMAAAIRAQWQRKAPGNERCACGCGRRARRCVSLTRSGEWAIAS